MNVSDMIKSVNLRTDEDFLAEQVISFLNDAVAKINAECNAVFPNLDLAQSDTEYVLPEKWQRLLLVTYAAARIKQNDSSQFEYQDLYMEFEDNLTDFKSSYIVPDIYLDLDGTGNHAEADFTTSPWTWEGGW
jgi:hypothetical protein